MTDSGPPEVRKSFASFVADRWITCFVYIRDQRISDMGWKWFLAHMLWHYHSIAAEYFSKEWVSIHSVAYNSNPFSGDCPNRDGFIHRSWALSLKIGPSNYMFGM